MNEVKKAALQIAHRSERYDPEHLAKTFVDVGPLDVIMSNKDHQVVYGRRGTGKTHLFKYEYVQWSNAGHIAIYIDLRALGSNGGLYGDTSVPLPERASRLLADFLNILHNELLSVVLTRSDQFDLSTVGPILDQLADAITEVKVTGDIEITKSAQAATAESRDASIRIGVSPTPGLSLAAGSGGEVQENSAYTVRIKNPTEQPHLQFGKISAVLQAFVAQLGAAELRLLIDEWAELPRELQPYLADMLKRSIFHIGKISCKIAGIAQRCNFSAVGNDWRIGFEPGADAASILNLDEYMVFENDNEKTLRFFTTLISRHIRQLMLESGQETLRDREIMQILFTDAALEEFVVSCEGIPRDALHILQQLVQMAGDGLIQKAMVSKAARVEFLRTKQKAIESRVGAAEFLNRIFEEVIGRRKARAFLVESSVRHPLIDYLYDERILHVIKESVSSSEYAGKRYTAYCIDYGCYADLYNTTRFPEMLLGIEVENEIMENANIPRTDYRSIRRAILDFK